MNKVFFSGRLADVPKLMGAEGNKWGLVKFWHKDGEDGEGNPILSYRTVYTKHPNTVQYLLDRGWTKGDEVFVEGSERIEKKVKDGKEYINVVIFDAFVSCGLKQGDTLAAKKATTKQPSANYNAQPPAQAPAPSHTPAQPPAQAPAPAPNYAEEPRSMAELEEFDEESMVID